MDQTGHLTTRTWLNRPFFGAVAGILLCCLMGSLQAELSLQGLSELTPTEQYRQLNLVVMISEGMDSTYLDLLQAEADQAGAHDQQLTQIRVEDFQTPLNRIVDQDALIANAASVFRFAQDNGPAIEHAIEQIAATHPEATGEVNLVQLAEDAIIVRTAVSSSLEYSQDTGNTDTAAYLQRYQDRTIYLRNVMEYWSFTQELAELTEDAMDTTGGRMEAYQRMLEDEPELDSFRQHLQAVEYIYWQTTGKKKKPPKLPGEELIEAEADVN